MYSAVGGEEATSEKLVIGRKKRAGAERETNPLSASARHAVQAEGRGRGGEREQQQTTSADARRSHERHFQEMDEGQVVKRMDAPSLRCGCIITSIFALKELWSVR